MSSPYVYKQNYLKSLRFSRCANVVKFTTIKLNNKVKLIFTQFLMGEFMIYIY